MAIIFLHIWCREGGERCPVGRLPVWYLAQVAQGVLPLAVTDLIELCERLRHLKSVSVPMLIRVRCPGFTG